MFKVDVYSSNTLPDLVKHYMKDTRKYIPENHTAIVITHKFGIEDIFFFNDQSYSDGTVSWMANALMDAYNKGYDDGMVEECE